MKCWQCGCPTQPSLQKDTTILDGQTYLSDILWDKCYSCGQQTVKASMMESSEKEVASKIMKENVLGPQRLIYLRKVLLCIDRKTFASKLGIREETYRSWEDGTPIPEDMLQKLWAYFGRSE